jgi:histidinol-phosphate aminotransferase
VGVTRNLEDYVLPWVRSADAYSARHMDFAWAHPDILRMMSNENPWPPSEAVMDATMEAARNGNLYPGSGEELRRMLAEKEGIGLGPENVVLGNGSTDVIDFVIRTFVAAGEEVLLPVPTFSMYEARVRICGGVPVVIPMPTDQEPNADILIERVTERTKLAFICSPNNPLGVQFPETELRRFLELGLPTFIDEAYYELEDQPRSLSSLIPSYANAMVSRTFSKAYGMAGFRLGYLLADASLSSFFNRVRIPWNVSLLTLAAAKAAIDDDVSARAKREAILVGRRFLEEQINAIPGLRAFRSEGNFVLIDAASIGKASETIRDELLARGVFIRPMSPHHMPKGFIRVTVGAPEDNRRFIEILRAYVNEIAGAAPSAGQA